LKFQFKKSSCNPPLSEYVTALLVVNSHVYYGRYHNAVVICTVSQVDSSWLTESHLERGGSDSRACRGW